MGETEVSVSESEDAVILVYQDGLLCGPCSEEFVDLVEFLEHKVEHALAPNIYKCELCRVIFCDQMALIKHYRSGHVMPGFGEELLRQILHNNDAAVFSKSAAGGAPNMTTSASNKPVSKHVGQCEQKKTGRVTSNVQSMTYSFDSTLSDSASKTNSENNHQEVVCVVAETGSPDDPEVDFGVTSHVENMTSLDENNELLDEDDDDNVESQEIDESTKQKNKRPERTEGAAANNGGDDDFTFILKNVVTNSKAFSYARLWFQCFHCPYKTQAKTALVKHMGNFHRDLRDLHRTMDVRESDNDDYDDNNHNNDGDVRVMKMSTYERIYCSRSVKRRNVDSSNKTTKNKKRKRNIEKQDLPGTFPCKQCNKVFGRLRYLRKHVATHRTERKYLCDECGKGFTTKTYLTHHRKSHVEKVFRCSQCAFTSRVGSAVHAHRQVHTQGSILCDICGLAYADKSALNKHKRVHDPKRPYSCSYTGCQWRFKTEVMCKAHIRAHTSEGKFACTLCGYVFRHKHHLQRHELKVHGSVITKAGYQAGTHSTAGYQEGTHSSETQVVLQECDIPKNTVNLVINTSDEGVETLEGMAQQLVVATGSDGTPIALRSVDVTSGSGNVYHALLQQDAANSDTQTVLLTQPE